MKKITLLTLVAGIALLASCKNESVEDNYVASLPENVCIAAKVDVGTLLSKVGESEKFAELKNNFTSELSSEIDSRNLRKLATAIIDNPNESGINFDKPAYLGISFRKMEPTFVVAASICNEEQLKKAIDTVIEKLGSDMDEFDINEKDGINYISYDGNEVAAFNGTRLVAAIQDDRGRRSSIDLKELISDNTLPTGTGFADFAENNSDASLWMDCEQIYNLMKKELSGYVPAEAVKGTSITAALNFNKGSMDVTMNSTISAFSKAIVDKFNVSFDPKLAEFLPKNPLFVAGYSVDNFDELLDMMPAEILDEIEEEMESSNIKIDDFGGSFAMAVLPYDRQRYTKVEEAIDTYTDYYSDYYSFNSKKQFAEPDIVFAMTGTENLYLFLRENLGVELGFTVNYTDGVIVARTNGTSEYTNTEGRFYKNFKSSPLFDSLAKGGVVVDFNQFDFGFLNGEYELGDSTAEQICAMLYNKGIFDLPDSFTILTQSPCQAKIALNITDNSKNSLAVVLDAALRMME